MQLGQEVMVVGLHREMVGHVGHITAKMPRDMGDKGVEFTYRLDSAPTMAFLEQHLLPVSEETTVPEIFMLEM